MIVTMQELIDDTADTVRQDGARISLFLSLTVL